MSCQFQAHTAPVPALGTEKHVHSITTDKLVHGLTLTLDMQM